MTGRHPYDLGWPDPYTRGWYDDDADPDPQRRPRGFDEQPDDYPGYDPDPPDDELEDWYLGLQEEDARTDRGAN